MRISSSTTAFPAWRVSDKTLVLEIDLSIYSLSAVLRASYKFTNRCSFFFSRSAKDTKQIYAYLKEGHPPGSLNEVLAEFCNELLDQQIRDNLWQETGTLRDIIIAQAFAEGNLLDADREDGDYLTDPRGAGGRR